MSAKVKPVTHVWVKNGPFDRKGAPKVCARCGTLSDVASKHCMVDIRTDHVCISRISHFCGPHK
jgi:hypothetical protein